MSGRVPLKRQVRARENQPLEGGATRPPLIPKDAQILARAGLEPRQIRRIEKSADAEENGFDFVRLGAQSLARKPLREESERELVLFVAKRSGQFLEERLVGPVQLTQPLQPKRFALQAKLRRSGENAVNFFLRQPAQRRMTAS